MGPKMQTFAFLETMLLLSRCKLKKTRLVKTLTSCACILRVRFIAMCESTVFIQSDITIWSGMQNMAYSFFFSDLCEINE